MQCIGRGLISLGKKPHRSHPCPATPSLKMWDDHFLRSHIYLESDNSLPIVSCWSLSSIVQDLHYSTGNQWEVQWLERCVSHSDLPLLTCSGLEIRPSTQLHPWELREVREQRQRDSSPIKSYRLLCPVSSLGHDWTCANTHPSHTVCTWALQ